MYNTPETFGPVELLVCLILLGVIAFTALVYWKIFAKTGHPGVLGILMLLPIVNFVMLLYLAFSEWPIEREYERLTGRSIQDRGRN